MRRTPRTLLAAAAIALTAMAGCGTSSSGIATGPTTPTAGPVQGAHVRLVSMTGGGGRVSTQATLLDNEEHLQSFTRQFGSEAMKHRVRQAVSQARSTGLIPYGAVVTLGCDRPPGADVALDGNGNVVITPHEVASPLPECLAPVTTVAIASVPGSD
ncbi:MAG: hypothetical protein QM747_10015 [Nocardioides sp.]